MAFETWDDFEDNDLSEWTINWSGMTTDTTSSSGSYAAYGKTSSRISNDPLASRVIESGGRQIDAFRWWYRETSNAHGHAIRLKDSAGNPVVAAGCDNPAPWASDGSNLIVYSGGSYTTWYKIEFTFDWGAGTYTFDWNNGSIVKTNNLNYSTDIETVELIRSNQPGKDNISGIIDGDGGGSELDSWWDNIQYDSGTLPITIDGAEVQEITIDGTVVNSLTIDGTTVF